MSCTYCNDAYHTVQECEHPDSVLFYAHIAQKLKKNAYDFWELYQMLDPLTVGEVEMVMVSLGGPIDMNKSTLIARIIQLNFEYELARNDFTDANAITCIVSRAVLLIKRTLKDSTKEEVEMYNQLLQIRVGNLVTETTEQIIPIIKERITRHLEMGDIKTKKSVTLSIKHIGADLFYTKNPFNLIQRSTEDPEVLVDFEDTADLLFRAPLVIKPMVVIKHINK